MLDSLAGSPVELVKANLGFGFRGGEELDAKGDKRDLKLTGPERTWHVWKTLQWLLEAQAAE